VTLLLQEEIGDRFQQPGIYKKNKLVALNVPEHKDLKLQKKNGEKCFKLSNLLLRSSARGSAMDDFEEPRDQLAEQRRQLAEIERIRSSTSPVSADIRPNR